MRTTDAQVKSIIEVDEATFPTVDPFIEVATVLVDDVEAAGGLTESRLELIERYLAAHFYAIRDPRVVSETAGPVSATYQSKVDLGLANTHFGQQAMILDTTGTLAAMNERAKKGKRTVGIIWAGKEVQGADHTYPAP